MEFSPHELYDKDSPSPAEWMGSMTTLLPPRFLFWISLTALILTLDLTTKYWVVQSHGLGDSTTITNFFSLVRAHNPGAAFSLLANQSGWQRWFLTILAMAVSVFLLWQIRIHHSQRLLSLSMTCILGGALGNTIDRMMRGHVIDFLSIQGFGHHFPTFNMADIAITIGVAGLVIHEVLHRRSLKRAN